MNKMRTDNWPVKLETHVLLMTLKERFYKMVEINSSLDSSKKWARKGGKASIYTGFLRIFSIKGNREMGQLLKEESSKLGQIITFNKKYYKMFFC